MWSHISLLLLAVTSVHTQQPTVVITETEPQAFVPPNTPFGKAGNIYATRDLPVTLTCLVENLPSLAQVIWRKKSLRNATTLISQGTALEDNVKFSVEKPTPFSYRLRVKAIRVDDEGDYTCLVHATRQTSVSATYRIAVFVPPKFKAQETSPDTVVSEGEAIDLLCNATGRPFPVIEWTRIGNQLLPIGKERHMESKLTISNVKADDRGQYKCKATNQIGSIVRIIKLGVRFKPVITRPRDVKQAVGYLIELQCFAVSNPEATDQKTQWLRGNVPISPTSSEFQIKKVLGAFNQLVYELIVRSVKESDYGTYTCVIGNQLGQSRANVRLIKTDEPQPSRKRGIIIAGSSAVSSSVTLMVMTLCVLLWRGT